MKTRYILALLGTALLLSGCMATIPVGKTGEYGTFKIGFEPSTVPIQTPYGTVGLSK